MKYSRIFGKTIKHSELKQISRSYEYLDRGGYVRPAGKGLNTYMPLGWRVLQKICDIIREEMEEIEGQELHLPFVVPYKYIENSGRADLFNKELAVFKNRHGHFFALSPAQEESMTEQVRSTIHGYEDLPLLLFQFQSKYRDIEKCTHNLLNTREFFLNDAYSFHLSYTGLNNFIPKIFSAYSEIFKRCGVHSIRAEAGTGFMGGERAFEFLTPYENGDETVIQCSKCGYTANKKIAKGIKKSIYSNPKPIEKVSTKGLETSEELAKALNVDQSLIAKTEVFRIQNGFVMAVVRTDYHISQEKLSHYIKDTVVRKANRMEIEAFGLIPGHISPIDLNDKMTVVIDDTVANSANLIMGANEEGYHYINCNFGVDFETDQVADIAMLNEKDLCNQCGSPLKAQPVIEIGKIFKLSNLYSKLLKLKVKNEKGRNVYLHMGSYRIGMNRLLTAIAADNSDDKGLIWPEAIAPYKYYLIGIGESLAVKRELNFIYSKMKKDCLFDDRKNTPAEKFRDADLLGIPYRIVVSEKLISDNKVEIKIRRSGQIFEIDLIDIQKVLSEINEDTYFHV